MFTRTVVMKDTDRAYRIPEFVQLACRFKSHVQVRNDHSDFNAKSIMGMMSLDPLDGPLIITANGEDEEQAANELAGFLVANN